MPSGNRLRVLEPQGRHCSEDVGLIGRGIDSGGVPPASDPPQKSATHEDCEVAARDASGLGLGGAEEWHVAELGECDAQFGRHRPSLPGWR